MLGNITGSIPLTLPNDLGIPLSDGTLRCVRIIPIPEGELLKRRLVTGVGGGNVLSLPCLADDLARTFLVNVRRGLGFREVICLRDLGWVLKKMGEDGDVVSPEDGLECLCGREFLDSCLARWPAMKGALVTAGVCEADDIDFDAERRSGSLRRQLGRLANFG